MKKLLIALLAVTLGATAAHAQKTKAEINSEINALFPDNTTGSITPTGLRTVTSDIVTSIMPTAPVVSGNQVCFDGTTGLLKDCGTLPSEWQVPDHAVPIGKGAGVTGFTSVGPAASGLPLVSNGASSDPSFKGINGTLMATSYGVVCDGATNNTTAFAALTVAIGTGGKRVILPPGKCLTASWSISGLSNIVIEGQGGADITETVTGTALVCTQAGSTTCFDWSETRGVAVKDVTIGYNSSTFTGTVLSIAHAASTWTDCSLENVQFKQIGATSHTAGAILYLKNTVQCVLRNVKFEHAQDGIVGDFNGGNPANTTNVTCHGCTFIGIDSAAIRNPGPEWSIIGSWFFPKLDGTPVGIVSEAAYTVESLSILGSSFTDATLAGTWIDIGSIRGFTYHGGSMGGNSGVAVVGIKLGFVSGSDIAGVYGAFLGTGIQVTSTCDGLHVHGVDFSTVTTPKTGTTTCTNSIFESSSPSSMNTIGVGAGKTFKANSTMTFSAGADGNTYTFASISGTIASLNAAQAWTNVQTFGDGNLVINGATSGSSTLKAPATGGGTITAFQGSGTIAGLEISNVFTVNQSLTLSQNSATQWTVTNTNAGTSASAAFRAVSNSGTFSLSAANNPNTTGNANVTWSGASSMVFASSNAAGTVAFQSGGFTTRIFVHASGATTIGSSGVDLGAPGRTLFDDYAVTAPKTVGTLSTCNSAAKGARSFVTDANATTFASTVAAGGANNIPVVCNGTNWIIGANDNVIGKEIAA